MDNMHEIVDLGAFARAVAWVSALLPLLGVVLGLLTRSVRKGLGLGLLGPLMYGLWLGYSYLIRYEPASGYCGLHSTRVLLLSVVAFALVGVGLGLLYSWLFRGPAAEMAPVPEEDIAGAGVRRAEGAAERH